MSVERVRTLLDGGHTCVRIVTTEEAEARDLAFALATDLKLEPWTWSATRGLVRGQIAAAPIPDTHNPTRGLLKLRELVTTGSMIVLIDLADHLSDALNLRALRDLIDHLRRSVVGRSHLLMIDHSENVPAVIGSMSVRFDPVAPDDGDIEAIVRRTLSLLNRDKKIEVRLTSGQFKSMVYNLRGLNRRQVEQIVTECIAGDRVFSEADIETIMRAKRRWLEDAGVLEFVEAPTSLGQIGGLARLKQWLGEREHSFGEEARKHGLEPPRGVMLLGVQGAGKSLAAKAIATAWRRPLMRLDPGSLFDKYIGETERRLREALKQAERMSPVVLWIDEIEKGFASAAGQSSDGGVSRRMFGTLLTWMQEHRSPVFLVATANDIEVLPPELLRKGRFDEIFFVDLPAADARRQILSIHLAKRTLDPATFDLGALADATEGYSGAEIEQAVLSALHRAFAQKKTADTALVMEAARGSPPLSVTMRERVDSLREWARGRCVPAD